MISLFKCIIITDSEAIGGLNNEELKIDDINYKQLLMDKLKELGKEYAKKNKLSSKTTQSIAKKLLESLVIK